MSWYGVQLSFTHTLFQNHFLFDSLHFEVISSHMKPDFLRSIDGSVVGVGRSSAAPLFFVEVGAQPPSLHFCRITNNFLLFYHGQLIRT